MPRKKPIKHHYHNRAHLKYFCLPNGTLYQYIMRPGDDGSIQSEWAGGNPNTVGWVKHLYDSPADTDDHCHIESELGKIEHSAMTGIERILTSKPVSFNYQTEQAIVIYIAAMAMRAPNAMQGKAQLDPLVKAGLVKGDYPNNPGPEGILKDVQAISRHLEAIQWYLYWFDGQDGWTLVTSDRPVGIYGLAEQDQRTGQVLQPSPLEAGLPDNWTKQAIFTFPLTARCAVLGFEGSKLDPESELCRQVGIECDDRLPGWVNSMSAWQASCVYTPDKGAKFLLPNPPEGPGELQFTQDQTSGIYRPQPRNRMCTIEEFVPSADRFFKANAERVDPNNPADFVAKVQALRSRGLMA